MPQMIEAPILAVTLTGGIDEGQIARRPDGRFVALRLQKSFFQRDRQILGETDADKACRGDGITVANQGDRLPG